MLDDVYKWLTEKALGRAVTHLMRHISTAVLALGVLAPDAVSAWSSQTEAILIGVIGYFLGRLFKRD